MLGDIVSHQCWPVVLIHVVWPLIRFILSKLAGCAYFSDTRLVVPVIMLFRVIRWSLRIVSMIFKSLCIWFQSKSGYQPWITLLEFFAVASLYFFDTWSAIGKCIQPVTNIAVRKIIVRVNYILSVLFSVCVFWCVCIG